jgi:YidC/Oxa1 family membrane protein insertase
VFDLFPDLGGLIQPLITFPSPPGWNAYVDLLERSLDFLATTFNSAGLAVIVFTIIIKTLLLPLTIKATRSARSMQELQPKIKELQKKHGKDRQKLSQETMKLYSQYQVNPMAGCLPMLIQLPIFFGLYRAILHLSQGNTGFEISPTWEGGFLWMDSLAQPDPWHVLPILAGIFQFVQTKMMRPQGQGKPTDPQQAMMNQIMNFLPITVILFGWGFAAGPVLYWVSQSVYSVIQQWLITGWGSMRDWFPFLPDLPEARRLGYRPPRDLDEVVVMSGDGKVQQTGVMGWVQKRMEEAQRQQAAARGDVIVDEEDQPEPVAKGPRPVKKSQRGGAKKSTVATATLEPNGDAEPEEEPPGRIDRTKTTSYSIVNGRTVASDEDGPAPARRRSRRKQSG